MNDTISLGGYEGIGTADWAMKLTNIQANSIITPVVPSMNENLQLLILGLSLTNTAAFTYYRYKVYSYIHQRFKGKDLTPVDFMTLTVCLVQHSELLWDLIMGVIVVLILYFRSNEDVTFGSSNQSKYVKRNEKSKNIYYIYL